MSIENKTSYELYLNEIKSNPYFKVEQEHDEREGTYEDCLYHIKNGHLNFVRHVDHCVVHFLQNGILIENLNRTENQLKTFEFYNNDGNLVFSATNYDSKFGYKPIFRLIIEITETQAIVKKIDLKDNQKCLLVTSYDIDNLQQHDIFTM